MSQYFGFTAGTQFSAQPAPGYQPQASAAAYVPAAPQVGQGPAQGVGGGFANPVSSARPATFNDPAVYSAAQSSAQQYAYNAAMAVAAAGRPGAGAGAPAAGSAAAHTFQPQQQPQQVQAQPVAAGAVNYQYAPKPAAVQNPHYPNLTIANTSNPSTYSGYEAAMYSAAASSYYSQQQTAQPQQQQHHAAGSALKSVAAAQQALVTAAANHPRNLGVVKRPEMQNRQQNFRRGGGGPHHGNYKPREQSLHYCEVCKISCAGPQTYKEHLDGQKHKKKEAASKIGQVTSSRAGQKQLRCELCDVTCTGVDAYTAHIRGSKHEKTLKLHQKLGKPIPSTDPVVLKNSGAKTSIGGAISAASSTPAVKKIIGASKITFVGGTTLKSAGARLEESKSTTNSNLVEVPAAVTIQESDDGDLEHVDLSSLQDKDVAPVGYEYVDEMRNELGKVIQFHCKLCDCKFNDPNAKEMHLKGRRHRLQYKKKVDPSLEVEAMPSMRLRRAQEEKMRRQQAKADFWRRRDMEERMREMQMLEWANFAGQAMRQGMRTPGMRKPESADDRHVMAKHSSIYPTEEELQAVQRIVSSCEKALKAVSSMIPLKETPAEGDKQTESTAADKAKSGETDAAKKPTGTPASTPLASENLALRGVMRVGVLAKGLLLHGDLNVRLVLLCAEVPTHALLDKVVDLLPKQLETVTEDKFELKVVDETIVITSAQEPVSTCTIQLTSPIIRDQELQKEGADSSPAKPDSPPDAINRTKCLEALATLRHAKWFQAKANCLKPCVIVIRILRDLCQRVPTWSPLSEWAMEVLVHCVVASDVAPMAPGGALRRVFECLAGGLLLPGSGGPGLLDPCERGTIDATKGLSAQEREDITASAQHALRLIAFRQIHKVLDMDPLPVAGAMGGPLARKRRLSNGTEGAGEEKKNKQDNQDAKVKRETPA